MAKKSKKDAVDAALDELEELEDDEVEEPEEDEAEEEEASDDETEEEEEEEAPDEDEEEEEEEPEPKPKAKAKKVKARKELTEEQVEKLLALHKKAKKAGDATAARKIRKTLRDGGFFLSKQADYKPFGGHQFKKGEKQSAPAESGKAKSKKSGKHLKRKHQDD